VPFERLCEYVLQTQAPGAGKTVMRLGRPNPRFPYLVRIVLTRRGNAVVCADRAALDRAARFFTPERIRLLRQSNPQAREIAQEFGARDVLIDARFSVRRDDFRPRCYHEVLRLKPSGKDGQARVGGLDLGEAFVILRDDRIACRGLLLTYPEFPDICEITNLHTEPRFRRKDMARSVVSAIASEILSRGALPVFTCAVDNAASMKIAHSLGFRRFATEVVGTVR